jgi:hypothetical protein
MLPERDGAAQGKIWRTILVEVQLNPDGRDNEMKWFNERIIDDGDDEDFENDDEESDFEDEDFYETTANDN